MTRPVTDALLKAFQRKERLLWPSCGARSQLRQHMPPNTRIARNTALADAWLDGVLVLSRRAIA